MQRFCCSTTNPSVSLCGTWMVRVENMFTDNPDYEGDCAKPRVEQSTAVWWTGATYPYQEWNKDLKSTRGHWNWHTNKSFSSTAGEHIGCKSALSAHLFTASLCRTMGLQCLTPVSVHHNEPTLESCTAETCCTPRHTQQSQPIGKLGEGSRRVCVYISNFICHMRRIQQV